MKKMVNEVDETIGNQVSKYMCSETCPCSAAKANQTLSNWTGMSTTELAAYKRAPQMLNSY